MTAPARLEGFIARFDDEVAATARACLAWARALLPSATVLVYDAYNALSISLAAGDNLGSAFVAVVVYPRHVNLSFHRGAELDDPKGLLQGSGSKIRHVRIDDPARLDRDIEALARRAARHAGLRSGGADGAVVIKSVYPRQRPRRPRR